MTDPRGRPRFWQAGGGNDRNIVSEDHLRSKTQYIHENPVRRGLVATPTDWPWSSARDYELNEPGPLAIGPAWETTRQRRTAV